MLGIEPRATHMLSTCSVCHWATHSLSVPQSHTTVIPSTVSTPCGTKSHMVSVQGLAWDGVSGNSHNMSKNVWQVTSACTQSGIERLRWAIKCNKNKHTQETSLSITELSSPGKWQTGFTQRPRRPGCVLQPGWKGRALQVFTVRLQSTQIAQTFPFHLF